MNMQVRRPGLRGSRADSESSNRAYLVKNVSTLRATHQIRMLGFRASLGDAKLILKVPKSCTFHKSLNRLIERAGGTILRESC